MIICDCGNAVNEACHFTRLCIAIAAMQPIKLVVPSFVQKRLSLFHSLRLSMLELIFLISSQTAPDHLLSDLQNVKIYILSFSIVFIYQPHLIPRTPRFLDMPQRGEFLWSQVFQGIT